MFRLLFIVSCVALAVAAIPGYLGSRRPLTAELPERAVPPNRAPSQPAAADSLTRPAYVTGIRAVRIPMDRFGHFSAEFRINGRRVNGLIDTGATSVAINNSTARRVGLHLSAGEFSHRVRTANGLAAAAKVTLPEVEINSIKVRDVQAFVLADSALSGTLIGMSFMSKLASYRVEDRTLHLEQ